MNINEFYNIAREGDRAAESSLFRQLTVSFRLFAQQRIWNDQDAEEVVQEAVLTISERYRDITFETSFSAWAYRVLNHKILDYIKRKGRRQKLIEQVRQETDTELTWQPDPDLRARLIECFQKMNGSNPRHARILNLHYQGFTTGEICSRLKLTDNYFYVMLSRARTALEVCLEEEDTKQ